MNFDDVKYKLSNFGTEIKYKLDDLIASPKARIWLIGGGVLGVLVIVFAVYALPRLFSNGPSGAGVSEVKQFRGKDQDWIAKARAALAGDAKYAAVTIEESTDEGGGSIIVIRGPFMDMPERLALGAKFKDIGQPQNLVYQLGEFEPARP